MMNKSRLQKLENMHKWIIFFSLLLWHGTVQAHQPDLSSTILSEQGENKWVLQVRAALTCYEYEIHQHYGEGSYTTPEEFQELVIQHVKENISIHFNESDNIVLKNGIVKLGHETNAVFEVEGVPENIRTVKFKNSSFKDISRNQSALIILKTDFKQKQFVLDNSNQHTVHFAVKDSQLVSLTSTSGTNKAMAIPSRYSGIILVGFLGFFIFLKYRTSKIEGN